MSQRTALFLLVSLELAGSRLTFTQSSAFQTGCSLSGQHHADSRTLLVSALSPHSESQQVWPVSSFKKKKKIPVQLSTLKLVSSPGQFRFKQA